MATARMCPAPAPSAVPVTAPARARLLPLVGTLAATCLGAPARAADLPVAPGGPIAFEAPGLTFSGADNSLVATRGFVAHMDQRVLVGDAMRYSEKDDELYANGRIIYVMPGVRLHAERIGLHPRAETGDAWNVEIIVEREVEHQIHRVVLQAARVSFDRHHLMLGDVTLRGGYGGIVSVHAASAHVYLRDKPNPGRDGAARDLEGLKLVSATTKVMGMPVLWVPWAYRDFTHIYPWTRFEAGSTHRLGAYGRFWIGSDFPDVFGWRPRLELRGDAYSRTGETYGATASWRSPEWGAGQVEWFNAPHEIVMGGADERENLETRSAHVLDAEQRLHASGGDTSAALSARYVTLPDADPPGLGLSGSGLPPDERFRTDYLRRDLETRPFARQGAAATVGDALGAFTVDTERRANPFLRTADRLWGVEGVVPDLHLLGPLHVGGQFWTEDLRRQFDDSATVRTRYDTAASVMQWMGGLGIDGGLGVRGLDYQDIRLAGIDRQDAAGRHVYYQTAGVRVRMVGELGEGLTHTFTPRVGVAITSRGYGQDLPAFNFGDSRELLDEDQRYLTIGFDTALSRTRGLFVASVVSFWGLRQRDLLHTADDGTLQTSGQRLVDVQATVQGTPTPTLTMTGAADYDNLNQRFKALDFTISWIPSRHAMLRYTGTLQHDPTAAGVAATVVADQAWQHRPGLTVVGNRYRFDADVMLQPGGPFIDAWALQLTRRMVDGELTLFYDVVHNSTGELYDRRIGLGFSLSLGGGPDNQPQRTSRVGSFPVY